MSCRTGSCGNLKLPCMTRTDGQSSSIPCKWWATSAEIMTAAVRLKCRINIWLKVTKGYSLQIVHPHGQPMNVFDIHLRNEHFQFLQPLADSSTNSGSSSACQNSDSVHNYLAETDKKGKIQVTLKWTHPNINQRSVQKKMNLTFQHWWCMQQK